MGNFVIAIQPAVLFGKRWLARHRSESGIGTNSSHIGWGIGALVIVGGVLVAMHGVFMPWIDGIFKSVTGVSTSTGSTSG